MIKLTPNSAFKQETIKIYVGDKTSGSIPSVVPKPVLCRYRYFRNALSPPFVESQTGVLHFPEDTEDAWSVLLYYFFRNQVCWPEMRETTLCSRINLMTFTRAYVLADKYELPALQNKISKVMMRGLSDALYLAPSNIEEAMSILPAGSALRWVILEKVVLMVVSESKYTWADFEELVRFASVFTDLMTCFELYNEDEDEFPPHEHHKDANEEMKKYFVEETRGSYDEE